MIGIWCYVVFLVSVVFIFWLRDWYKIDHSSLLSQGMFWGGLIIPLVSFVYFGCYAWEGYSLSLNAAGLNEFISISKLPLGLLSLSIPFVAIVTSVHRSIQTQEQISTAMSQIELAKKKNSLDEYYAREKNFVDKCSFVEKKVGSLPVSKGGEYVDHKVSLSLPHKLFNVIYKDSKPDSVSAYEASDALYWMIVTEVETISENLKLHMEKLERGESPSVDEDAVMLFVIMRSFCRTLDFLHVDLCPMPYFSIKKSNGSVQLCVTSEKDLKQWLRRYVVLVDTFIGLVWPEKQCSFFNIRRYVYVGAYYFAGFESGSVVQEYNSLNWEGTVGVFK